jgi:hypothetical protein
LQVSCKLQQQLCFGYWLDQQDVSSLCSATLKDFTCCSMMDHYQTFLAQAAVASAGCKPITSSLHLHVAHMHYCSHYSVRSPYHAAALLARQQQCLLQPVSWSPVSEGFVGDPWLSITLTLCHILHSVSHWPVLVYYFITLSHLTKHGRSSACYGLVVRSGQAHLNCASCIKAITAAAI